MALATRELELILIARDNASAVIARVGGAMAILGGIVTAAGLKGARELGEMTKEAIEFRQQIALAVTQADDLGANIGNVTAIVNRVGTSLSVPFEELNEALFDIFSTFTKDQLSNLEDAEMILRAFGESAVAGQAPVRDIARSTIAWINALDQPATLENITRLLDIQFELVRKGAGEYGEFAGEVGKSIPAFAAANQSVESFAGIMAFLTKNGLNAAMAATSAARAAELMFSPKAIEGLGAVGIAVEDSNGKFRAMEDIIGDLVPIMGGLSDAQKKLKFKEIFGTGRIQARRFFDLAIPNFAELQELIFAMENSGGGVAEAFRFMFEQPLSQMDLFKNKFEALRRTIGDTFIESLQTIVFPLLQRLFDWWDKLTPEMQSQIAKWLGWGAAIATVGGILLTFLGLSLLIMALFKAFATATGGIGIAKLLVSLGWVGVALAIIAGLAFLLYKNWDKVWPFLVAIWDKITEAVRKFFEANRDFFDAMLEKAKIIWSKILKLGVAIWERAAAIWARIWENILVLWDEWGDRIIATAVKVWDRVKEGWLAAADIIIGILDFFIALFEGDWEALWVAVQDIADGAWRLLKASFLANLEILKLLWSFIWEQIKQVASTVWNAIFEFFRGIWNRIHDNAVEVWGNIKTFFSDVWNSIVNSAKETIEGRGGLLEFFQALPGRIVAAAFSLAVLFVEWWTTASLALMGAMIAFSDNVLQPFFMALPGIIVGILLGTPNFLWNVGKTILTGLWRGHVWAWNNLVVRFWTGLRLNTLRNLGSGNVITWLLQVGIKIVKGLLNGAKWFFTNLLVPWYKGIGSAIKKGVGDLAYTLWGAGLAIIGGLWGGMKRKWKDAKTWLGGIASWIKRLKGPYSVDLKLLVDNGSAIMEGLEKGMKMGFSARVEPFLKDLTSRDIPNLAGLNSSFGSGTVNNNNNEQIFQFGDIISDASPDDIAAAIAWEVRMT